MYNIETNTEMFVAIESDSGKGTCQVHDGNINIVMIVVLAGWTVIIAHAHNSSSE